MQRAMQELEQLNDQDLFTTLSEGLQLIVNNVADYNQSASRLYEAADFRASEIISGYAEEEAAKALILLDYVRGGRTSKRGREVLRCCYDHVAKRIYSMVCKYQGIHTFAEMDETVKLECRGLYLDGPNGVDWIFTNAIAAKREQDLYVDYIRDVTDAAGTCSWQSPARNIYGFMPNYLLPTSVRLVQCLSDAGLLSIEGLAVIAEVWRSFQPAPETTRDQLRALIAENLNLHEASIGAIAGSEKEIIYRHWTFPLWPLEIKAPRLKARDLKKLRKKRKHYVKRIMETAAVREPAPAVSREKVEDLSNAHEVWTKEVKELVSFRPLSDGSGLQVLSSMDIGKDRELASYAKLTDKLATLSKNERVSLLALAWFCRDQRIDWPGTYEYAKKMIYGLDDAYQIRLGEYWLAGLERWESVPQSFEPGKR